MTEGLEDIAKVVKHVVSGGADAVVLQPGALKSVYREIAGRVGVIVRATLASIFNRKRYIYEAQTLSVRDAIRLGADAVIASLYIGGEHEFQSIEVVGRLCSEADRWGVPCIVESFPSLDRFESVDDPSCIDKVVRIATELGADMIKVYLPKDPEVMKKTAYCARAPLVLAGGEATTPMDVLTLAKLAVDSGLAGVCFGRKVFRYRDPAKIVKALSLIVHENVDVEYAAKALE